jgi:hypothetical protein
MMENIYNFKFYKRIFFFEKKLVNVETDPSLQ